MTTQAARSITLPVQLASVISANHLVELDNTGSAVQANAASDNVVGVALEASTDSQDSVISVALIDGAILEIEAGATITAGALLGLRADGRVGPSTSGNRVVGRALNAATAGNLVEVATAALPAA